MVGSWEDLFYHNLALFTKTYCNTNKINVSMILCVNKLQRKNYRENYVQNMNKLYLTILISNF